MTRATRQTQPAAGEVPTSRTCRHEMTRPTEQAHQSKTRYPSFLDSLGMAAKRVCSIESRRIGPIKPPTGGQAPKLRR
jgi:hypothetical protein